MQSRLSDARGIRVLFVNDVAFIVESILPALAQLGVHGRIVGRRTSDRPRQGGAFLRNAAKIGVEIAGSPRLDILHINYSLYGFLAIRPAAGKILHCHGSDIRPGRGAQTKLSNLISHGSMKLVDKVWFSTTDLRPFVESADADCRFMPNPVAESFFEAGSEYPSRPHVLFAVPLSQIKGADIAIEAMRLLARREPGLMISAFGYGWGDAESTRLRKLVPPQVNLLPWTPHGAMPALLASASVVVGGLRLGSLGVVELESMATGRPVVAMVSQMSHSEPYYSEDPPILNSGDSNAVVESVLAMVDNRLAAEKQGEVSRAWVRTYHHPAVVAREYRDEYVSLLSD